jgi:1-acyl-sn-glycerol-3-phosphate acyltransferase
MAVHAQELASWDEQADRPLIVCGNHAGWWDPIVAHLLCRAYFPNRTLYAPIDAIALRNYEILRQLGFYGLDLSSRAGAAGFLRTSFQLLRDPKASIWMTPEGRFCDPRDRTQALLPGAAHLASKTPDVVVLPLAIEYPFVDEKLPEILCWFGKPLRSPTHDPWTKSHWEEQIARELRRTQDALAEAVVRRQTEGFRLLLSSSGRSRSWYDFFRRWSAQWSGRPFQPFHGTRFR